MCHEPLALQLISVKYSDNQLLKCSFFLKTFSKKTLIIFNFLVRLFDKIFVHIQTRVLYAMHTMRNYNKLFYAQKNTK